MLVPKLKEGSSLAIASDNSARPVLSNCSLLITSIGAGLSATVRSWPRKPVEITVTVPSLASSAKAGAAASSSELVNSDRWNFFSGAGREISGISREIHVGGTSSARHGVGL